MAYSREAKRIENELQRAWTEVLGAVTKMHPSSQIKPRTAAEVFRLDGASEEPKFDVAPVVFNLPERANGPVANLYVAVSGWICFGDPLAPGEPRTTLHFGTNVGYFRLKGDYVTYVCGVHYDMDDEASGHPVFHAQMCSQAEFAEDVWQHFHRPFDGEKDLAAGLLRNVRIPTAQMDVFSVIMQIAADHLVAGTSAPEVWGGFENLSQACSFFRGAAGRITKLNTKPATHCYRSMHWYVGGQPDAA